MLRFDLAIGVTLLLTAALPAQTEPPELELCTLDIAGPAIWQTRLHPTNLGSLLATAEGEALWRPTVDHLDEVQRKLAGDGAATARARLVGYQGALRCRIAGRRGRCDGDHADLSASLALVEDGHTDVAELVRDVGSWLRYLLGDGPTEAGELPLFDKHIALPHDARGGLAIAALAAGPAERLAVQTGPLLRLRLDVQVAAELLARRAEHRAALRAALGCARSVIFEVDAIGPRWVMTATIDFGDGDRGFGEGWWPERKPLPELDWLVPDGATASLTSRGDAVALWRTWMSVQAAMRDEPVADVERDFESAAGIAVSKDLLAHVGDELAIVWWPPPANRSPALLDGAVVAVALRDERSFRKGLQSCWGAVGGSGQRDGVWFATVPGFLFLPTVHYAVGHGFAFLAVGQDRSGLDALLERAASPPVRTGQAPDDPSLQGHGTIAVVDLVGERLASCAMLLRSVFGTDMHLAHRAMRKAAATWLPLLRRHGLEHATTTSHVTAKTWRWELAW